MDSDEFITKMKNLGNEFDYMYTRDQKIIFIREYLDNIDKYSYIVFKEDKFKNFIDTFHIKLHEFKEERKLKIKCYKLLEKYFNEKWTENRCNAITCCNDRCKNLICKNLICKNLFCNKHKSYYTKIYNCLSKYLISNIATKCIDMIF